MVEFRGPLAGTIATEGTPPAGKLGITISEHRVAALGQIAGWGGFETTVKPALDELGFEGLGDFKTARTNGDCTVYRIAPDRLLLRHSRRQTFQNALGLIDRNAATVLDQSHARVCFKLSGPAAEEVLSKVVTIDTHISAFRAGDFVQTGVHSVAVLIHRLSPEQFDLLVPFTWARSTFELICQNARSNGLVIARPKA